jgi:iron complex transport system substrate-binding protein
MTKGLDSVGGIDGLLELPGVSSTRAAASSAVIAVDDDLLLSFGPRTGALITRLAELLNTFSSDA